MLRGSIDNVTQTVFAPEVEQTNKIMLDNRVKMCEVDHQKMECRDHIVVLKESRDDARKLEETFGQVKEKTKDPIQKESQVIKEIEVHVEANKEKSSTLHMTCDYNNNSQVQGSIAEKIAELLQREASKLDTILPSDSALQVVEHGCATGCSSLAPLRGILEGLSSGRTLHATMNDLPLNAWDVLKATVESQFQDIVFDYAKGTMYLPVAKKDSVHLVYSCYAQHWLSEGAPTGLPNSKMWANQLDRKNKYRKKWEEASKNDWELFLTHRANEVVKGGSMVLHIQCSMCDGSLNETFPVTCQRAKERMIEAGDLTTEQAMGLCIPEFLKSPIDVLEPLSDPGKEFINDWKLVEFNHLILPCPFMDEYEDMKVSNGDVVDLIERQLRVCYSFMNSSIDSVLDEKTRDMFWAHVRDIAHTEGIKSLEANYAGIIMILRRI
eukprot:CAMPEP_0194276982 /NCGR_PEP_ID=MMETSP0169-20130528/9424_1 /TAXON_ID=218684 /ORGANISM="Corethron pennatum, Strain L29A3" /LENGTH=437 /DNA_ID=CAMNT_0039020829 /DNA_START=246 /DNA_END=1559 /DNA_ORIENTATION=+